MYHFIVGRDHAGVGSYYGRYEAQEVAVNMAKNNNLGIEILPLKEPYYCIKCDEMVSEKHCCHSGNNILKHQRDLNQRNAPKRQKA